MIHSHFHARKARSPTFKLPTAYSGPCRSVRPQCSHQHRFALAVIGITLESVIGIAGIRKRWVHRTVTVFRGMAIGIPGRGRSPSERSDAGEEAEAGVRAMARMTATARILGGWRFVGGSVWAGRRPAPLEHQRKGFRPRVVRIVWRASVSLKDLCHILLPPAGGGRVAEVLG